MVKAHTAEIVTHVETVKFAKRSEAEEAFQLLSWRHASVLFKKDSHGWWRVARSYGLAARVQRIVDKRAAERDAEDRDPRHLVASVVARRRRNAKARQFTVLELRFVARGEDGARVRRTVFAGVDRFVDALEAFGIDGGATAGFKREAEKAAHCCVNPDSDDEAPTLSAAATDMLEEAVCRFPYQIQLWLEAVAAVEAAVPALACDESGVSTYGGVARVASSALTVECLCAVLRGGGPDAAVAGNRGAGGALGFDGALDCPSLALSVDLPRCTLARLEALEAALEDAAAGAWILPVFPKRWVKRDFARFDDRLDRLEAADRTGMVRAYLQQVLCHVFPSLDAPGQAIVCEWLGGTPGDPRRPKRPRLSLVAGPSPDADAAAPVLERRRSSAATKFFQRHDSLSKLFGGRSPTVFAAAAKAPAGPSEAEKFEKTRAVLAVDAGDVAVAAFRGARGFGDAEKRPTRWFVSARVLAAGGVAFYEETRTVVARDLAAAASPYDFALPLPPGASLLFGLHRASGRQDRDFTLEAAALVSAEDFGGGDIGEDGESVLEVPLYDDEHDATGRVLLLGDPRIASRADFEKAEATLRRDAVLVYERRKDDPAAHTWSAFFCTAGGLACEGGADDAFCSADDGETMTGGAMLCGDYLGPEFEDETIQEVPPEATAPGLEIERADSPGPAGVARVDGGWIRLGCAVPLDANDPKAHVPRPASLDLAYGSFKKADEPEQDVTEDWHVAPDPDGDEHGWSYAAALRSDKWHGAAAPGRPYRRQIWHRFVRRPLRAYPVIDGALCGEPR
ncbi:hypothetical protein JL722_7365 [Aureococcus anophagefferens]|nr:hypothetical protein JL722_7365 [Aureococcus anophagefferens]